MNNRTQEMLSDLEWQVVKSAYRTAFFFPSSFYDGFPPLLEFWGIIVTEWELVNKTCVAYIHSD